jgi:hypothetical protein
VIGLAASGELKKEALKRGICHANDVLHGKA